MVTASNNGYSSASGLKSSLTGGSLLSNLATDWLTQTIPVAVTDRTENAVSRLFVQLSLIRNLLPSRERSVVCFTAVAEKHVVSGPFASNVCFSGFIPALSRYATIYIMAYIYTHIVSISELWSMNIRQRKLRCVFLAIRV
jgi:hypothetical protein